MSFSTRFARFLAGMVLMLLFAGSTAMAQIYVEPGPPRYYPAPRYTPVPGPGGYYVGPSGRPYSGPVYEEDLRPRRRVRPQEDYGYRDYRYGDDPRPRRRAAVGSVCVTSRGSCDIGGYIPLGSGCRCRIPGFGSKGGYVRY